VGSAGIIADHPSDRASIVSRRIGRKSQLMGLRLVSESVQHNSRLNPRNFFVGIDLEDPVHVLREIENDRDITALPGETSSGTASQDGSTVLPARSNRRNHVFDVPRDHQSDGDLPVV
jgi:hypothetical protein